MAAPTSMFDFKKILKDYCDYVKENPEKVTQIESAIRSCSYVVAGLLGDSEVLSELLYSAASLLQLINDTILKQAKNILTSVSISIDRLKTALTAVEYVEVLIELTADRYGTRVKWAIVSLIEIVRLCLRLVLLLKYKAGILPCPPVVPLCRSQDEEESPESGPGSGRTYTLTRSGRRLRALDSSPPSGFRTWELPPSRDPRQIMTSQSSSMTSQSSELCLQRQLAETLHIIRPTVHLLSMYGYGVKSWKPWLLACGVDVSSLLLMRSAEDLTPNEQSEMRRRTVTMLFYLLRSPFYDKYAKTKILLFLNLLADVIPGIGLIIRPLLAYLPSWQKVYFYTWAQ